MVQTDHQKNTWCSINGDEARLEMRWRILFKSMCLLSRFVPDITVGSEDEKYLTSFVAGSAVSNSILSIISHKR
ncbi:hypothetical protein T12_6419 [Trichinella patagoniensis]|uniref:Uncharacterized protein n=1 Tax=Trichinella patagoniensis TaxID=990121 RepID=A0A0V0ZFS7_9BILA|nr:hypothetical protein T12_6419 [Trichinella patagoniensis]